MLRCVTVIQHLLFGLVSVQSCPVLDSWQLAEGVRAFESCTAEAICQPMPSCVVRGHCQRSYFHSTSDGTGHFGLSNGICKRFWVDSMPMSSLNIIRGAQLRRTCGAAPCRWRVAPKEVCEGSGPEASGDSGALQRSPGVDPCLQVVDALLPLLGGQQPVGDLFAIRARRVVVRLVHGGAGKHRAPAFWQRCGVENLDAACRGGLWTHQHSCEAQMCGSLWQHLCNVVNTDTYAQLSCGQG